MSAAAQDELFTQIRRMVEDWDKAAEPSGDFANRLISYFAVDNAGIHNRFEILQAETVRIARERDQYKRCAEIGIAAVQLFRKSAEDYLQDFEDFEKERTKS